MIPCRIIISIGFNGCRKTKFLKNIFEKNYEIFGVRQYCAYIRKWKLFLNRQINIETLSITNTRIHLNSNATSCEFSIYVYSMNIPCFIPVDLQSYSHVQSRLFLFSQFRFPYIPFRTIWEDILELRIPWHLSVIN